MELDIIMFVFLLLKYMFVGSISYTALNQQYIADIAVSHICTVNGFIFDESVMYRKAHY